VKAIRNAMSAAALMAATLGVSSWLGCNEIFSIEAPVHEARDGGGGGDGGGMEAGAPQEDCLDGIDNDGDGKIDCEDVDCLAGYTCVDTPESPFTGPLYVQHVPYPAAEAPMPCPDGKEPAIYYADPSPAACTACACAWQGAACTAPEISVYHDSTCNLYVQKFMSSNTACINPQSSDVGPSVKLTAGPTLLSKGTCTPSGGELMTPSPTGTEVRVCAAKTGGGCDVGKVCVKKPSPMFEGAVCMSQGGNVPCPVHWTDPTLDIFDSFTDKRACSACGCDLSAVTCGGGKYVADAGSTCMPLPGGSQDITALNACVNLLGLGIMANFNVSLEPVPAQAQGMKCGTSAASGAVETSGEATICCHQLN